MRHIVATHVSDFLNSSYHHLGRRQIWETSMDDKKKVREADELARTGQQYMKQKPADYSQAIECYTQAISLNPTVAKFFFMRGQCYKNKNQHQKCLVDYTMALRIEPKDKTYLEARGTCHRRLNMPIEAVKDYTAAIALDDKQGNYFQCDTLPFRTL
jgi:tetratricopeptide (TPR) repeat protein